MLPLNLTYKGFPLYRLIVPDELMGLSEQRSRIALKPLEISLDRL